MFSLVREGRSPAESRPKVCRLVRPGAAAEMRTDARRYRGMSVRFRAQMRVVPRKEVAFRPCCLWDEGHFLLPVTTLFSIGGRYAFS